jgi:hypothetical protein
MIFVPSILAHKAYEISLPPKFLPISLISILLLLGDYTRFQYIKRDLYARFVYGSMHVAIMPPPHR